MEEASRRTGGRSARVRAAVQTAALEVILEKGIDKMSISEVAQRAGVHETSIYRRWGGRDALAASAVLRAAQVNITVPDTGNLRDDLLSLLHELVAYVDTPEGQLLLRLALRLDRPEYEGARDKFRAERLDAAAAVLRRAEERGELRAGTDREVVLTALVGPLVIRLLGGQPLTGDFLDDVVNLVLTGVASQP